VFVRRPDENGGHAIDAYPPSGEASVVWRESNASSIQSGTGAQLLAGPR
jgi:hypothetical protein